MAGGLLVRLDDLEHGVADLGQIDDAPELTIAFPSPERVYRRCSR